MAIHFKHQQLDNGLTIIGEVNDEAHTAATGFFVKVGARDEHPTVMGVSHFLEHMMFKGTDRRTADDVNRDFDRIGANYNAATSQETTFYYAHVLPEFLGEALDLLADIMRPTLREDDFDMEKNVILEEIGMYEDRPFWQVYETGMESYFGDHGLGLRILGTNETIRALDAPAMRRYFQQRYSPDNMVVSLAGRVDFDACVEQLARATEAWQPSGVQREHGEVVPQAAEQTIRSGKLSRHYVLSLMPGPSRQDERRYAAAVLANLLGDSDGSRLYWELIDPGLAEEAELSHQPFDETGTFLALAVCPPERADQVERVLDRVLSDPLAGIDAAAVERSRNKLATDLTLEQERPIGRMLGLGGTWLYTGEYRPLEEEMRRLMAVDLDQVRELCDTCDFTRRATVRATPDGSAS